MTSLPHLLEEAREEFERKIDKETAEAGECGILNIYDFFDEAAESLIKKAYAQGAGDEREMFKVLLTKHLGQWKETDKGDMTLKCLLMDLEDGFAEELTSEPSLEK